MLFLREYRRSDSRFDIVRLSEVSYCSCLMATSAIAAAFRNLRLLIAVAVVVCCSAPALQGSYAVLPSSVVWAWDRPEDLRFLPSNTAVALLMDTVTIRNGAVSDRFRAHPARLSQGQPRISVVRIETKSNSITQQARSRVVESVLRAASLEYVTGVQIDFDARVSERAWYRELLEETRRRLPADKSLSITALASWCSGDDWISGLPIDEGVPMIFRLGPDRDTFRRMVASGQHFREPLCNRSIGLSTDEPIVPSGFKRVYWFSPVPWTPELYKRIGASR
jgi:hypothetical protein